MRFLSGFLCGVLLTILIAFVVDSLSLPGQRMVNWEKVTARFVTVQEEVREEVHEATRPERTDRAEPLPTEPKAP
jgi:hypothetical protein